MTQSTFDVSQLPGNTQQSFREFGELLFKIVGADLLGFSAFGGWRVEDPFYYGTPARSVVVLEQFDLRQLDKLAEHGPQFGRRGLSAPLIMTPKYIEASCDVFPLELLEIQQTSTVLSGEDHFGTLDFDSADLRLQCERELKSELIQLRQGLLAAAGKHDRLGELCRAGSERALRVMRGLAKLKGLDAHGTAEALVREIEGSTGLSLPALTQAVKEPGRASFDGFERFYEDLTALAGYVDRL